MELYRERVCGIDIGKAAVVACVRIDKGPGVKPSLATRTFSTTTAGLTVLRDWLVERRVQLVGMESTGVYWKRPYYLLEDHFQVWLLNPQHIKIVPGRKSDVQDSQWLADLTAHGLVRPSFVPPRPIRGLRDTTRYRTALVQERTRCSATLRMVTMASLMVMRWWCGRAPPAWQAGLLVVMLAR